MTVIYAFSRAHVYTSFIKQSNTFFFFSVCVCVLSRQMTLKVEINDCDVVILGAAQMFLLK